MDELPNRRSTRISCPPTVQLVPLHVNQLSTFIPSRNQLSHSPPTSCFQRLIEEASQMPTADFQLSPSYTAPRPVNNTERQDMSQSGKRVHPPPRSVLPARKVYLSENVYTFDEGVVSMHSSAYGVNRISTRRTAASNALLKRASSHYRNNCLPSNFVKSEFFQNLSYHRAARPRYFSEQNEPDEGEPSANANEEMDEQKPVKFAALRAENRDRIVRLYALNDLHSSETMDTQLLILVQEQYVNIWFKMDEQSHWKSSQLCAKRAERIFTTQLVRFPDVLCLFCLATDGSSVFLKYAKIELNSQSASFLSIETFPDISPEHLDFIYLSQVTEEHIAISMPRQGELKVDLFLYQLEVEEANLTNLKKSLLHTFERTCDWRDQCIFRLEELSNQFICIFNRKLYIWKKVNDDFESTCVDLNRQISSSTVFFDAFYDSGLIYLFKGNLFKNEVKIVAVNVEKSLAKKLMSFYIERKNNKDDSNSLIIQNGVCETSSEPNGHVNGEKALLMLKREVKIFKRHGDQLIIVKRDGSLIIYCMIQSKIMFEKKVGNLQDACVGAQKGDPLIFAAYGKQKVVNLLN